MRKYLEEFALWILRKRLLNYKFDLLIPCRNIPIGFKYSYQRDIIKRAVFEKVMEMSSYRGFPYIQNHYDHEIDCYVVKADIKILS